jgi:hypothetical protein
MCGTLPPYLQSHFKERFPRNGAQMYYPFFNLQHPCEISSKKLDLNTSRSGAGHWKYLSIVVLTGVTGEFNNV